MKNERFTLLIAVFTLLATLAGLKIGCRVRNPSLIIYLKHKTAPLQNKRIYLAKDSNDIALDSAKTDDNGRAIFDDVERKRYVYVFKYNDSAYVYSVNVGGTADLSEYPEIHTKNEVNINTPQARGFKSKDDSLKALKDSLNHLDSTAKNKYASHNDADSDKVVTNKLPKPRPISSHKTAKNFNGSGRGIYDAKRPIGIDDGDCKCDLPNEGNGREPVDAYSGTQSLYGKRRAYARYLYAAGLADKSPSYIHYFQPNGRYDGKSTIAVYTNCIDCNFKMKIGSTTYKIQYSSLKRPDMSDLKYVQYDPVFDFTLRFYNSDLTKSYATNSIDLQSNECLIIGIYVDN